MKINEGQRRVGPVGEEVDEVEAVVLRDLRLDGFDGDEDGGEEEVAVTYDQQCAMK